jgi:predicted permease
MESLKSWLLPAARALAQQPLWSAAAILSLGLGVGLNATAFSVANALLLRPLPFDQPNQVVLVAVRDARHTSRPFSWKEFEAVTHDGVGAELAARTYAELALSTGTGSYMVEAELVSQNYFDLLRVSPRLGGWFTPNRYEQNACDAVISFELWQRRFAGDPQAVGTTIVVNNTPLRICGVAPSGFVGAMSLIFADVWIRAEVQELLGDGTALPVTTPRFGVVGRLRPDVSRDKLAATIGVVLAREPLVPQGRVGAVVVPAAGFGVPPVAQAAVATASALIFLLLTMLTVVSIANVVGLMFARAMDTRRATGIQVALGARPTHILRQSLGESAILAVLGYGLGLLLATSLTNAMNASVLSGGPTTHIRYALDLTPDTRVLLYALFIIIVTAVALAGLTSYLSLRVPADLVLKSASTTMGLATVRGLTATVVVQIAVSTVLLTCTGLMVRTYLNLLGVEPGIQMKNITAATVDVAQVRADAARGREIYRRLLDRISGTPGVESVVLASERPLAYSDRSAAIWDAAKAASVAQRIDAATIFVSAGYFALLDIDLRQGKEFGAERSDPVAVVNETLARALWGSTSAIDRVLNIERSGERYRATVIGVAADVKSRSLTEPTRPVVYLRWDEHYTPRMTLLVKSPEPISQLRDQLEREIRLEDPGLALISVATLDEQLASWLAFRRQSTTTLALLCAVALSLTAIGIYGVVGFTVRRARKEVGIRLALGARRRDIVGMVLRRELKKAAGGLTLGLLAAFAVAKLMAGMLYGVTPYDVMTLVVVCGTLFATAVVAAFAPATAGARMDPMEALRQD